MSARFETGHYLFPLDTLPPGWTVCALGEIAEIQIGQASGRHNREGQGVPHLRPMNISADGELDLSDVKYIADGAELDLVTGDVLFNNTNSPLLVGKTAHVKHSGRLAFSNHMTRVRPFQGIDGFFLARQLHALHRFGYFRNHCKQYVNQASITSAFLKQQVPILLPPEGEQRRISVHLEELLARRLRASTVLDEIPELTRQLRQALLWVAYTGKLTAGWRTRNKEVTPTSDELVVQIREERRHCWLVSQKTRRNKQRKPGALGADYPEPVAPDTRGVPPLPETWRIISFDELAWSLRSGTSAQAHPTETPHRILRSSAVRPGIINYDDVAFLDEQGGTDDYLAEGDLLLTRLSGSLEYVGNCAIVRGLQEQSLMFPDRFFRARVVSTIDLNYVEAAFECAFLGAGRRAKSSTGQHRISLADLRAFPIPLPPLAEQREIVRLLESTRASVATILDDVGEARQQLDAAERLALVRAFTGRLVPQEPSDEAAAMLLAQLRLQPQVGQSLVAPTSPRATQVPDHVLSEDGPTRLVTTLRRLGGSAIVTDLARAAGYLPSEDEVDKNDRVGAFYLALASARQQGLLMDRLLPGGEVWLELSCP